VGSRRFLDVEVAIEGARCCCGFGEDLLRRLDYLACLVAEVGGGGLRGGCGGADDVVQRGEVVGVGGARGVVPVAFPRRDRGPVQAAVAEVEGVANVHRDAAAAGWQSMALAVSAGNEQK